MVLTISVFMDARFSLYDQWRKLPRSVTIWTPFTESSIVPRKTKTPVPLVTVWPLVGLSALLDEPCPLVEDRPASIPDTNGNSTRSSERPATLPQHLVH